MNRLADESSLPTHASEQCRSACRYLATILAALRYWQQDLADNEAAGDGPISPHFDEDVTPLSVEEIDELCERLNFPSE